MCPDENELTEFARGGATDLASIEAHLDDCEECRRAVAAAASDQTLPREKPALALSAGARIDRYEIERELGRGGMGAVYQARDVTLDRRVALKLLHAKRDDAAQARMLREARVMAKLAHPNVVPIFELGEWNHDLYLAMELIPGVTLEAWLKRAKHRGADVIRHFVQAGRGLAAAHAAGVVHRDFKPANVLVGLDDRVRVTDFGLSRPAPTVEVPPGDVVTRTGAIVGTLAYMSPEQLVGKTADERSDQFSFCVSLVEALSGQRPFAGDTVFELAQSLKEKPRFGAGISTRLRSVLRKGLELEPSHRYASMTALLNAIERATERRWRGAAAAAVAAMLTLGLFAGQRMRHTPRPPIVTAPQAMVPILTAAEDIPEGSVVTSLLVAQAEMPRPYVSASFIAPERTKEIVGQVIKGRARKGDPLLWTQFDVSTWITVFRRDVPAGSVLSRKDLEERRVQGELSGGDVVLSDKLWSSFGRTLLVDRKAGDVLRASMLEDPSAPRPAEALTDADVAHFVLFDEAFMAEEARCRELEKGTSKIWIGWHVTAEGVPYDVKSLEWWWPDSPTVDCIIEVISNWKFPARSKPRLNNGWSFRL